MQLQAEHTQFKTDLSVFDQFDDGVAVLDSKGTILYQNPRVCRFLHTGSEGLVGRSFISFLSPSDARSFELGFRSFPEKDFELELYFSETRAWARARGFCFHFQCIITLRDVSSRHQSDETLEALRTKVRSLVDSNLIGIMTTKLDGRILEANDAILKMLGYDVEDLRAGTLSWRALTPPEWKEVTRQMCAQVVETGKPALFEKEYFSKDGRRVPVMVGVNVYDSKRGECVTFVLDLTAQKQLERNAAALRESQDRVRAREVFCAIASHELKTPLTSLNLHMGLLERALGKILTDVSEPERERAERSLEQMRRSARKVAAMVNVLMDVEVMKTGRLTLHPESVDLVELIGGVIANVPDLRYREASMIEVQCPPAAPAYVDPVRIEQVVSNLLGNAIKYGCSRPIRVEVGTAAENYRISVSDHGKGIEPQSRARIFEKFERVVSEHEGIDGLGLGLYVSRGIVEAHGGSIWFEENPGGGSRFCFQIPRHSATDPGLH